MPKSSNNATIEFFHASWCHHCKEFMPEWNKLKNMLPPNVEAKSYEDSENAQKMQDENIQGFPTIKITINGDKKEYNGERSAEAILEYIKTGESSDGKYKQCGGARKLGFSPRKNVNLGQIDYDDDKYYKIKYLKYKAKYMKLRSELGI